MMSLVERQHIRDFLCIIEFLKAALDGSVLWLWLDLITRHSHDTQLIPCKSKRNLTQLHTWMCKSVALCDKNDHSVFVMCIQMFQNLKLWVYNQPKCQTKHLVLWYWYLNPITDHYTTHHQYEVLNWILSKSQPL